VANFLYDGGVAMELYINDKLKCNSEAVYGGRGSTFKQDGKTWASISGIKDCIEPMPVKTGDRLKLVAVYDTEKHPLYVRTERRWA